MRYRYLMTEFDAEKAVLDSEGRIEEIRSNIARAALGVGGEAEPTVWLAKMVNSLAEEEGRREMYAAVALADPEYRLRAAIGVLQRGPDDGWSGRANDVRRARFDGVRDAFADVELHLGPKP